jgi:hypothetical protein
MDKHLYSLDFKKNPTYFASKYHISIISSSSSSTPQKWVLQLFEETNKFRGFMC